MRMTMGILAASGASSDPGAGILTIGVFAPFVGYNSVGGNGGVTHPDIIKAFVVYQSTPRVIPGGGLRVTTNIGTIIVGGTTIDLSTLATSDGLYVNAGSITLAESLPTVAGATVPYLLAGVPGV